MADTDPSVPVHFDEVIARSQATTLQIAGQSFVQSMDLQGKIATQKFDEVDLLQAAAAKELGKMGQS